MVLEEEFGLFQRTRAKNGRLLEGSPIISGRPKRKLRRIITRPIGFLTKPVTGELRRQTRQAIRKRTRKGIKEAKMFFQGTKQISVKKALELERTQILKGKKGKERKEIMRELMGG